MNFLELFSNALPRSMTAGRKAFSQRNPPSIHKRYGSTPVPAPDTHALNPFALGEKPMTPGPRMAKGKRGKGTTLTQHQRVVADRRTRNPKYFR